MKREVELYVIALLLLGIVFLFTFFQPSSLTGFAVFQESGSGLEGNNATFENVFYDSNLSAVILEENQTSGNYVSEVIDSGNENSTWDNLTWTGNSEITFEIRSCSASDCSGESFSNVNSSGNFASLNLSGRYFQYKAIFDSSLTNETISLESVSVAYSVPEASEEESGNVTNATNVTVTLSEPTGTKESNLEIPVSFSTTGENLTCWFNVQNSDGLIIIENTTLENCADSTFNLNETNGSYTFNIFVNSSSGTDTESLGFSVSLTSPEEETSSEEESGQETEESETPATTTPEPSIETIPPIETSRAELTGSEIQDLSSSPGISQTLSFNVKNTGTLALGLCNLKTYGDYASWVESKESDLSIAEGEQFSFEFNLNVPEDAEPGQYEMLVSAECLQTATSKSFIVNVVPITFEFSLIDVAKIRSDEVRARYTLQDLSGEDQVIGLNFKILDAQNGIISELSDSLNLSANQTERFSSMIPINESIEGNLTLHTEINSEVYSSSVEEPIILTAPPILGFVALGDITGTGGIAVLLISVFVLVAVVFFVRRVRKVRRSRRAEKSEKKRSE